MRKLRELIRLKYECGLSNRMIAASLSISAGTVSTRLNKLKAQGINDWPLPETLNDTALDALVFDTPENSTAGLSREEFLKQKRVEEESKPLPDFSYWHSELSKKGVTRELLWQEYVQQYSGLKLYSYSHASLLFREWKKHLPRSMRQIHKAGEKMFIDYCGPTMNIIDPLTGENQSVQIFVAILGASGYTYAEGTWTQKLPDFLMSQARALQFFGGVPQLIVPDNLRSAVSRPCRYDPDINPSYQQFAAFHQVAVLPARPYKPKDKAKAENAVLLVERWIMARLRHQRFHTLDELNAAIRELLIQLNQKPYKKKPGSRQDLFEKLDHPVLKPLPRQPYSFTQVKNKTVDVDYHVDIDGHYYSVPYQLTQKNVICHIQDKSVAIYYQHQRMAMHPVSKLLGEYTTNVNHMPPEHKAQETWSRDRFERWGATIGEAVEQIIAAWFDHKQHPEQAYRSCLGLQQLAKKQDKTKLNIICSLALTLGTISLNSIRSLMDNKPSNFGQTADDDETVIEPHDNIRGMDYYH